MAFTESQVLEALTVNMSAAYTRGLGAVEPQWQQIASEIPSSGSSNFYGWLKDLPGIAEWVADRQLKEMGSHGYAVENKTWESSIVIKREDVEDDNIGKYAMVAENYGKQIGLFPDSLSYSLLVAGFTTLCYDGQYFFDTDHPLETTVPGVFSNVVGTPATDVGSPWFLIDDTQVVKPIIYQNRRPFVFQSMNESTEYAWFNNKFAAGVDGRCNVGFGFPQTAVGSKAALTEANYEAAKALMGGMKKTDGSPLGIRATKLVVGPANEAAAKKLIQRMQLANGESNIYFNDVEVVVSRHIA